MADYRSEPRETLETEPSRRTRPGGAVRYFPSPDEASINDGWLLPARHKKAGEAVSNFPTGPTNRVRHRRRGRERGDRMLTRGEKFLIGYPAFIVLLVAALDDLFG